MALANLIVAILPLIAASSASPASSSKTCRLLPTDAAWPSRHEWSQLNDTVGGRLIATVPRASACHVPTFNADLCTELRDTWQSDATHVYYAAEVIDPFFQGNTCLPFTPATTPCKIGILASYSINASSVSDIQAGIRFATEHNVRLVIKNTGHDLLGKSTGKGSLALWTHNMNSIKFIDSYYGDSSYTGTAVRLGAGVMSQDILPLAQSKGLRIISGSCATVGAAGGYTAGGGHGALTSMYGLGADSVLEWEVVTARGEHLVATPKRNSDLYWALSGGGAGTFAVVVSMTTRTYEDGPLQWASFSLTIDDPGFKGNPDALWSAIDTFHHSLGPITDAGAVATYLMGPTSLDVFSIVMPGGDPAIVRTTLGPLASALESQNVTLNVTSRQFDTFWELHSTIFGAAVASTLDGQSAAGRLISRSTVENAERFIAVSDSFRTALDAGFQVSCTAVNASSKVQPAHPNAVFPLWREGLISCLVYKTWNFSEPWDVNVAAQTQLTNEIMPVVIAATPGDGAYLNEANFEEPDWQTSFYGANYPRLSQIKDLYDAHGLLYARTAVGSERWAEDGDHRLCRVQ
ncbi:hypothetical protein GGR54DRAFT_631514 [Hypoxylon sp. NC1633]|nr:hypothetical protein GGR54DRAFT_631514 [Hypoxylon sp. NC1633]